MERELSSKKVYLGEAKHSRADRDDGKRFIVRADEKLTAFIELEAAIAACGELSGQAGEIFAKLGGADPTLNRRDGLRPLGSSPLPDPQFQRIN